MQSPNQRCLLFTLPPPLLPLSEHRIPQRVPRRWPGPMHFPSSKRPRAGDAWVSQTVTHGPRARGHEQTCGEIRFPGLPSSLWHLTPGQGLAMPIYHTCCLGSGGFLLPWAQCRLGSLFGLGEKPESTISSTTTLGKLSAPEGPNTHCRELCIQCRGLSQPPFLQGVAGTKGSSSPVTSSELLRV